MADDGVALNVIQHPSNPITVTLDGISTAFATHAFKRALQTLKREDGGELVINPSDLDVAAIIISAVETLTALKVVGIRENEQK